MFQMDDTRLSIDLDETFARVYRDLAYRRTRESNINTKDLQHWLEDLGLAQAPIESMTNLTFKDLVLKILSLLTNAS